jgi:hypothetical protein
MGKRIGALFDLSAGKEQYHEFYPESECRRQETRRTLLQFFSEHRLRQQSSAENGPENQYSVACSFPQSQSIFKNTSPILFQDARTKSIPTNCSTNRSLFGSRICGGVAVEVDGFPFGAAAAR